MGFPSFLRISANGEDAPVEFGEDATTPSMGGIDVSNYLECSAFEVAFETRQQGRRTWTPARFVVRLGKSTPWLFEAARANKRIDLMLYLFRLSSAAEVEHHFQYRIQQGRITSIRLVQPDTLDLAAADRPERVEFDVVANVSEVESMTGSTEMRDEWAGDGTRRPV